MSARSALPGLAVLSVQQLGIACALASGYSPKQIAWMMGLSAKTVEYHRAEIYGKTGCPELATLTRWAVGHNLVKPLT